MELKALPLNLQRAGNFVKRTCPGSNSQQTKGLFHNSAGPQM